MKIELRQLRLAALLLAALAMGMHLAHALELWPKLQWDPALYIAVQSTLYKLYGTIGPILEVGALTVVSLLAWRLRERKRAFALTFASACALGLALVTWALLVLPANGPLAEWAAAATRNPPPDWKRFRDQWQIGQAFIFLVHLGGFSALAWSIVGETTEGK
ncbi:MAG TPA: hypothetical protein VNH80_04475 [Burkholderiales bacterium]|nr:hypothetical protein [Burkholderiales bacterium]